MSLPGQWINQPTVGIPRMADGKADMAAPSPKGQDGKLDLSGLWMLRGILSGGLYQLKSSEIKPSAEKIHKEREEEWFKSIPETECLPSGFVSGLTKIVQTPTLIVMLNEDLTYRQIFLDGRELPEDPNPAWMGYSVGRWEGDTLVIESTGFSDRTWLVDGYPHTEHMRITERIRRPDFGHLSIQATTSDPELYGKPWTTEMSGLFAADTELIEYVCAENEKDRAHLTGKRSGDSQGVLNVAPEILSKYTGSYEFGQFEFMVELEDGMLKVGMRNWPMRPAVPLSETTFAARIGQSVGQPSEIEFVSDEKGDVTHIVLRLPAGDTRAYRRR